jgi:LacI family transcriptional regulator
LKQALVQTNPSALIAISVRPDSDTIAAYTAADVPIVLIDEETAGVSTITTDNRLGGQIAGEYLIAKGKKKIAIVSGKTHMQGSYNAEQRIKGFQQALSAGKLSILPECMIEVTHYSREDGISVMPKLLHKGVDAIFCAAGDNCALGLLSVAREQGVRIPEDIAIMGFDDLLIAQLSTPKLTTIRQPLNEMAEAAYKLAVVHRNEILRKPQRMMFKPELVVRQSA